MHCQPTALREVHPECIREGGATAGPAGSVPFAVGPAGAGSEAFAGLRSWFRSVCRSMELVPKRLPVPELPRGQTCRLPGRDTGPVGKALNQNRTLAAQAHQGRALRARPTGATCAGGQKHCPPWIPLNHPRSWRTPTGEARA